jgi:hypothetical protein
MKMADRVKRGSGGSLADQVLTPSVQRGADKAGYFD